MTLRLFSWVLLVISAIILATVTRAESTQDQVLDCFASMDTTTEWNTCLNAMFAPCAGEEVGSEPHLSCLTEQRENWRSAKIEAETNVLSRLSEAGMEELSGLMLGWPRFVDDKCKAVAESRAEISYDAAALGCQISELALLTNEMRACLAGRSTEAYCQLRDE
ncbi:MAG: hypothetical protein QNJ20_07925 [Paracoccaceae bacterium]|nr:hypothetical protein [Paracoccaceae bacterium]